ncbi:MAG TPA: HAMP domain-containing sensor histidine kinase [Kiritimatiellia bacterium]|nr:HAMP domain-containing sensor histidine kinase [Kiritimatiellia bacterium]HRZ12398.1 HAMP domain-containing sensor histidine kinase [Kiritimatiellia bacterium]HSA17844.1 HAMP domain-containing sensor histidine kinase [Kiritimatiellia bacterium]
MKRTAVIIYWLILLVSALAVGAGAFRLLLREHSRLESAGLAAARGGAQLLADEVALSVQELEQKLGENLAAIPSANRAVTLAEWEQGHPLIRNSFVLDARGAVVYPAPTEPMTGEQERFLRRYEALFSGRAAWTGPAAEQPAAPASARQEFSRLAVAQKALSSSADSAGVPAVQTGWLPWYADNQIQLLGWALDPADGSRYGVELEMAAVLSRLAPAFAGAGEPYALLDGDGRVVFQSGALASNAVPVVAVPVGAVLPHWQVGAYGTGTATAAARGTFLLLTGLQVGVFVLAIILGGSLLLWQAHRHWRDAARKTSFVSNVSHELKTPLTSIRMYAEMLAEGRVKDDVKRADYLKVIVDQSQRLTRLVNNVLDFSRLEQRRRAYRPEPFDLAGAVGETVESQRTRLQEAGLRVEIAPPAAPCPVVADRDAVTQAVLNILDNAAKYAAGGGELRVEFGADEQGCRARFLDRGPGIPSAHRARLFEQFYRVDDSLSAKQPGCGLGLSIARRMMRDLGGDVRFEPREGGGAVFELAVPRERAGS